ncbi:hypothetical protein ISN44_As10g009510 [Arabidopsis suecica]|uniref:Retrotransposon gag domain-containing protein n=1 Tax=Arabidopsis suecica TaxID=45249 RepID=A0A8T1ZXH6_ARASU|nr:hypothetical protein ISN44_As10g009510 [Arabidopsis suecica]
MIMPSTTDTELEEGNKPEEQREAGKQLEPEERFELRNALVAEKEYGKDVILTSLSAESSGGSCQVVSEPNPVECGVKRAHTVGGYGLGAQRGRCDQLVGGLKEFNHNNQMYDFYESVERHHQGVDRHHTGNRPMTLVDYNRPDLFYENRRAIRPPAFERSDDISLQPAFYTLVSQHLFHGLPHEQPMDHIERFEDLVSIIKARVVSEDYLLRKLFSYSLAREAASWLQELIPGSLTTWQQTKMAFLRNFTKNYGSSPHQALPPPTSRQCRPTPVHKSEKSNCDEEKSTWFDTDLHDHSTSSLKLSELDTEQSTPDCSVDRHSPSVERHWTQTAPYALVFPPPSKKSELERRDEECRLKLVRLLYALPFDDFCKLQDPLQDYIEKMITNGISAEDVSLLIKDISAILVNPEKLHDPGSFVQDCSLSTGKFPHPLCDLGSSINLMPHSIAVETSTDITAGYVKELDSIEQVSMQASKLEDWSGDHLFSTRMQDEAHIGDKLLQIAEPRCRNSSEIRAAGSVSIDTTMVSVDTRFDVTDHCRPHHQCRSTPPPVSVDTTCVDRHPRQAESEFSDKAVFRTEITATSPETVVTSTTAPLLLHPPPKKLRYSRSPPKPPDFINKTFKIFKTVSRLNKLRVSRRALVRSFDDCAGKQSIPPIPTSHPADIPDFLGQPHAPTAYTPPWMMRHFSRKYLLPPSDPPDA